MPSETKIIKCDECSHPGHIIYHEEGKCLNGGRDNELGTHVWIPDSERPIEKADRFLKQSGLRKHGARGWI